MTSQTLTLDSLNLTDSVVSNIRDLHESLAQLRRRAERPRPQSRPRTKQIAVLSVLILIIGFVSVYDVYYSFKTRDVLPEMEQNPVGSWLIQLDGGDISLFMTCKMVGTMLVILAIPALYCYKQWWGMASATAHTASTVQCESRW